MTLTLLDVLAVAFTLAFGLAVWRLVLRPLLQLLVDKVMPMTPKERVLRALVREGLDEQGLLEATNLSSVQSLLAELIEGKLVTERVLIEERSGGPVYEPTPRGRKVIGIMDAD